MHAPCMFGVAKNVHCAGVVAEAGGTVAFRHGPPPQPCTS